MAIKRYYGGDIANFPTLIKENRVYVDKTDLIYKMTHDFHYVFLSRPRRFGKSLLCSTLDAYFEGRKDLFKGLAIEKLEKDWTKYPVLHFNMSTAKNLNEEKLESHLGQKLSEYEKKYNITPATTNNNDRLITIIKEAYTQENQEVVVIIDEYDAPLLEVVHEEKNLNTIRQVMRNFYSPLKACDEYLHFVFLTGITKFSQLSIFSEFNNLSNISMMPEYAAICGITEDELLTQLSTDIDNLAEVKNETREQTITNLKKLYDGYHFCWPSPDIYNPYSVINAFAKNNCDSFWFTTGTPIYLINMLRKFNVQPQEIASIEALAEDFDAPTENLTDITPLLYQSGYLTIKDYDPTIGSYFLDFPNEEVRKGLMKNLLPHYVSPENKRNANMELARISALIHSDDMDAALQKLKTFLLGVPYPDFIKAENGDDPELSKRKKLTDYEGYYQQLLYVIFTMLGCLTHKEIPVANGRIDLSLETKTRIYVIELKINKDVQSALDQINLRNYTAKYSPVPLPIYKLAITFDSNSHTLKDWLLQPAN